MASRVEKVDQQDARGGGEDCPAHLGRTSLGSTVKEDHTSTASLKYPCSLRQARGTTHRQITPGRSPSTDQSKTCHARRHHTARTIHAGHRSAGVRASP